MSLKIDDMLICTKNHTHGNMGTVCTKDKRYKIFNVRSNNSYEIGTVRAKRLWCVSSDFIEEHFVKEE